MRGIDWRLPSWPKLGVSIKFHYISDFYRAAGKLLIRNGVNQFPRRSRRRPAAGAFDDFRIGAVVETKVNRDRRWESLAQHPKPG
jgi:hypothetical protein